MRDAPALLPPIAPAAADDDEAARSGRAASAARWAWRRRRRTRRCSIHADGAEARRAALERHRRRARTLDVCTFILARDRLGDEIAAALRSEGRAGVARPPPDRRHRRLARRPRSTSQPLRRSGVEVVTFVPPFRSILRGRANLRNHRKMIVADAIAALVRRPQLRRRVFRGRPAIAAQRAAGTTSASTCAASSLRGARAVRRRTGPTRRGAPALARARRPAYRLPPLDASLAQLVPSGPEQVDDTVQALLVSGCFMAPSGASSSSRRTSFPTRRC